MTSFFASLDSRIEIATSGTQVYNMMGLKISSSKWDWLKCAVDFDGAANANANSRYWAITDHYSKEYPWLAGV